jgi:hypothetical protein
MLTFGTQYSNILLDVDQTAVTISENTTAERILAVVDIPAGLMGANGKVVVSCLTSHTSSANNKNYRVYLGDRTGPVGGALAAGTSTAFTVFTATASTSGCGFVCHIGNRSDAAVNVGGVVSGRAVPAVNAVVTGTIDTSAAQKLVVTVQKATGTESVTLESIDVGVLK